MSIEEKFQQVHLDVADLGQTLGLAASLSQRLRGQELILLKGDLGSGKTAFVKGLVDCLGGAEASSPSFTVENIYPTDRFLVHHYDFWRLDEPGGGRVGQQLSELLSQTDRLIIIEWPGLVADILPRENLTIELELLPEPDGRHLTYTCPQSLNYLLPTQGSVIRLKQ